MTGRTSDKTIEQCDPVPIMDVLAKLDQKLADGPMPDYVRLSGSGEPTLNERIGQMIGEIKKLTYIPVAVLTNGWRGEVQCALVEADLALPSLVGADIAGRVEAAAEGNGWLSRT